MTVGFDSITIKRELGAALQKARPGKLSAAAAGRLIGVSQPTMWRIENGQASATSLQLTKLANAYGVDEDEHLSWQRMLQEIHGGDRWWDAYDQFLTPKYAELIEIENEAPQLTTMSPDLVPGLIQSEAYMRALFGNGPVPMDPTIVDASVQVRLLRQRRLEPGDAEPLEFHVILGEAALHCRYGGGEEIYTEQLRLLREKCDHPQITLQIMPFGAMIQMSPVDLYTFRNGTPPVVYSESVISKVPVEHTHALTMSSTTQYLELARQRALSPQESIAMIERMIGS